MKRVLCAMALAGLMAGVSAVGSQAAERKMSPKAKEAATPAALDFTVKNIDGKEVHLAKYAGKVVMIVNVASLCGNTPQYKGLEAMYKKYKDQGFVILGFPANNFHQQEPGTNAQIKEFCTSKYAVTFPMFSKISVKGDDIAPLYKYLIQTDAKPKGKGDVSWNFEKFLIGRDGKVVARFQPTTKPDNPIVVTAVENALKK